MTDKTARRKAQKKVKRLKYRNCSKCGGRSACKLVEMKPVKECYECGFIDVR